MINVSQLNPRACGLAAPGVTAGALVASRLAGAFQALRGRHISAGAETDERLVTRVAQGDRQALQLLFGRHRQSVYRFALRLVGNSATAEDIVNDVFLELWRRAAGFER